MSSAVDAVLDGLGEEIDGLRHLITELRPAALDDLGLAAALQALARRMQAIDGLDVQTEIDLGPEHDLQRLDPELESTIYRVVQEALTNVSRHAQATQALVSVSERDGVVRASITDDGRGLPEADRLGPRGDGLEGGFGMSGMRERAELVRRGARARARPGPGHRDAPDRAAGGAPGPVATDRRSSGERGGVDRACPGGRPPGFVGLYSTSPSLRAYAVISERELNPSFSIARARYVLTVRSATCSCSAISGLV